MVTILMGVSVFSVGFFMLIVAVLDLLGISPRNFGVGERILVYGGGILLCVIGYYMASRRMRAAPSDEGAQPPPSGYQPGGQPPPYPQPGAQPPGYPQPGFAPPGVVPPPGPGQPGQYQPGPPHEEF